MGKKTGSKTAHPTRKYPRREALYDRRMMCGKGAGEICRATGMHYVTYMRLERIRVGDHRDSEPKSRFLWKGWRLNALRLADYYFCDPEELFPEEARCAERSRHRAESMHGVACSLVGDYTRQSALSPAEQYDRAAVQRIIRAAMKRCNPTERIVLKVMFGFLPTLKPPSFDLAGEMAGVTEQGALAAYDSALYKMCVFPELSMMAAYASDGGKERVLAHKRKWRRSLVKRRIWPRKF